MKPSAAHRRGIRAYRSANRDIWITCACARHIVGHYEYMATQNFAHDLARSVDSVERYAHAGTIYRLLRRTFGRDSETLRKLRWARDELTYSHFEALWKVWETETMSPATALEHLLDAAEHHTPVEQFRNGLGMDKPPAARRAMMLPVFVLGEGIVQRKLEDNPETRILILPDDDDEYAECRVTPVRLNGKGSEQ